MEISSIILYYRILPLKLNIKDSKISEHKKIKFNVDKNNDLIFKFKGNSLPNTMDYNK
jgi:hypothetical protein